MLNLLTNGTLINITIPFSISGKPVIHLYIFIDLRIPTRFDDFIYLLKYLFSWYALTSFGFRSRLVEISYKLCPPFFPLP